MRVEAVQRIIGRAIFVVVPLHAGHAHLADDFEALHGICAVADHVPDTAVMRAFLVAGVFQHDVEGLQVPVDVCYDGVLH